MSPAGKLFGRLLQRSPTLPLDTLARPVVPSVGLQLHLDSQGRVLQISGPMRDLLAHRLSGSTALHLSDYLLPGSRLAVEGPPSEWHGHSLDLDFTGLGATTLHLRGWAQPAEDGWLLQLLDIDDLLQERQQAQARDTCQALAARCSEHLRLCSLSRLPQVLREQLQDLAQQWRIPCVAIVLLDEAQQDWRIHSHYHAHDAPRLWHTDQSLGSALDSLDGSRPHALHDAAGVSLAPRLRDIFADAEGLLVPYRDAHGIGAWLLCGFYPAVQPAPALGERDWLLLLAALAAPLLGRLREQQQQQQLQRLDALQGLLGSGWWELHEGVQLAPQLARNLHLEHARLSLGEWLAVFHPVDRAELQSRLQDLLQGDRPLLLSVRLQARDEFQAPIWYRLQGQLLQLGEQRRPVGVMLDISDIKNQQQQAAAAHARLDNLIASSPAVIYVQRYEEGALQPCFFSDSLLPLLGWQLSELTETSLIERIHPDDRDLYFARTRQLLREGNVRARYRMRDRAGDYHWLLDEARLLRNDLGLPVEAVGLWLDDTEATLATEQVRQSEERYRILVEDSPAMICRYRPDLTLTFANRPLAKYLECPPEQLPGVDLGSWLSAEQRVAFLLRIQQLTPEFPVSTAEISLQLPGREHAWWVWSDRGVFDEQGQLLEVQAVGRDNTEVRRSQQQLMQSAKMATLGEMATGLAHEINQPLNVMRMAIVNVLKRLSNGEVPVDYLQDKLSRIDTQVQRAARVVDHMRVFGRRSEIEQQPFNPAQAVEGTLALLAEGMRGKGVELRIPSLDFEVQVRGHVDQLEQVLINLLVNARDALLSKREVQREFEPWISLRAEADARVVRLWVEDNGGGIDPRLLERIFEPFFTTKPVGVGTGLGLSVSYGIVQNMGGQLSVLNAELGACFCIELPIVPPA
ncbi:PAS domain-containing sensor histidine kinase [Pseudomonas sp. S04]|uniref:PAS domain-containing sensor histidine kinase n=1 Tax=Pseudomonas sp. S04 TaxID=1573714 RepID=UPI00132030D7|nr:PAS domain-containing sensor histidine kinase [Pseudomonas sp. S04]QHF31888.1 PAS domain-containing sensor histidine kinase [Pseudomonas sp. S19]